jgi:integrase
MSPRRQEGTLFAIGDTCYLKYRTNEMKDGTPVRVHKTILLCKKSDKYTWWSKQKNGRTRWGFSSAIRDLRDEKMAEVRARMQVEYSAGAEDRKVVEYWDNRFLPWCQEELQTGQRKGQPRLKPSTLRGYKQVYKRHLKDHFNNCTLQEYQPAMGVRLLDSLTAKQGFHVLKHIRAVASAIFKRALKDQIVPVNPWSAVEMPDDAIKPAQTQHYTREESEDLVSALVDHVDAQLVLSLACFLALGPAEIQGLQWGDIDRDWLHIRRNVVLGKEGTTKTIERAAALPLLDEVRVPLELWRAKCEAKGDKDRIIPDLHNLIRRVIIPHVKGENNETKQKTCTRCDMVPKASGVTWKGMYSARRGAITYAINVSGNIALGQRLARHKDAATTTAYYHKAMPDATFLADMKKLNK